jgi:hypothetical protein
MAETGSKVGVGGGGQGVEEEMTQTMYTHMNKCENNQTKKKKW